MTVNVMGIRATLEVAHVSASVDFYRRTLGLEPVVTMGEPPVFALLAAGGGSLGLSATPTPAVADIAACYVDVEDVDMAFAACTEAGAEITMPLTTHPWQMRDFVMRDPDGHQIAVGQRVGDDTAH